MSLTNIRTALKTVLEGVSGIGQVHDYKRYSKEWSTYKDAFEDSDKINFIQFSLNSLSEIVHGSNSTARNAFNFVIEGAYGLKDEDETAKTVEDLVVSIIAVFRGNDQLNNTAEVVQYPIEADIVLGMFGNILCHKYEIRLTIRDRNVF